MCTCTVRACLESSSSSKVIAQINSIKQLPSYQDTGTVDVSYLSFKRLGFVQFTFPDFCKRRKGAKCRQVDWYTDKIHLITENRSAEINNFKFNHCQQCNVPSDHVKLQTNNINLLLRSTDEVKTIFFPELILVIKKIKETTA